MKNRHHQHAPNSLGIAIALALGSASAIATAQTTTEPPQRVERVEIKGQNEPYAPPATSMSTKTDTPNLLTPQSVQVVPRAVLNEQKVFTLSDAVRNVSGVSNDFGFNGNAQPLLILRGFPSVSMSAMSSVSGISTYYLDGAQVKGVPINMADVQAVEVIKGPASVLYGRAEPGGLVNVISRPLSTTPRFGFEQTIGQFGLTRTVLEGAGALNEDKSLLGRATLSYNDGGSPRDHVVNRLGAVSATLGWVPGAATKVTASLNVNDQKYRTDFGAPVVGSRPIAPKDSLQYNDSPELSRSRSTTLAITAEHQFSDAWKANLRVLTQRADTREVDVTPYRLDFDTGEDCSARKPAQMCRYYLYARPDGRTKIDQATLDVTGTLNWVGMEHKLLATVDTFRSDKTGATYLQTVSAVDFFNPKPVNTPRLDTSQPPTEIRDDFSRWASLTLQDQMALGAGLHAVVSLRHENSAAIYAAKGTEKPNEQSFTTPRAGLVYQMNQNNSVYAQYQDSVAANNGRNPADGKALEAERARQYEVGFKTVALNGQLHATVAAYYLEKRNLADYSLLYTENTIRTIGKARSRGLEFDVLGQLTNNLAVMASYAHMQTRVLVDPSNAGKQLANAPQNSGSVWARYSAGPWAAGMGVFAQSQRQGDSGNTFQLPGYARVDAMLSYAFRLGSSKASVQANLNNVFNRVYYTGSHQFLSDWIQVGTPRAASVTLRVDF